MQLTDLIRTADITDTIFLLWRADMPNAREKKLLHAMLVACVEHGIEAPSAFVPRVVASTGNPMNAALAASALTIGEKHGGAIEAAARLLYSADSAEEIVGQALASKARIPGFGHKVYTKEDPRATALLAVATKAKLAGTYVSKAYAIEAALHKAKGKMVPLNIDGAVAAGMCELGLDAVYGKALFIIPRLIGAAAHVAEEQGSTTYHRLQK